MRKIKGTMTFVVIFLIILFCDFILYQNIEMFLQNHEREVYTYSAKFDEEQVDFLREFYSICLENDYQEIEDINYIKNNGTVYNILENYIYNGFKDNRLEKNIMQYTYLGKLVNTIYGNLSVIYTLSPSYEISKDSIIAYSDDMEKFYYVDITEMEIVNGNEMVAYNKEMDVYYDEDETEKSKEEIIKEGKESFSKLIINQEFEPDTIISKGSYYILKDNARDITVYYRTTDNVIFGVYIGFNK